MIHLCLRSPGAAFFSKQRGGVTTSEQKNKQCKQPNKLTLQTWRDTRWHPLHSSGLTLAGCGPLCVRARGPVGPLACQGPSAVSVQGYLSTR